MEDSKLTFKEQWYNISDYKDEVESFVKAKKVDFTSLSTMEKNYNKLYRVIFAGTAETQEERFPHMAEMYKTYKSAIIESNLSGYSALLEVSGEDAESVLKSPKVKQALNNQFKSMSLLETLSGETLDDWLLKGEAVGLLRLDETTEEYRIKQTVIDELTNKPMMKFTIKQGVTYRTLAYERIDPLDFYVDALDYLKDPRGSAKIVRSWINASTLLSSNEFPLLTKDDKIALIQKSTRNGDNSGQAYVDPNPSDTIPLTYNSTDRARIEVLTYFGDYVTEDNKVLKNIKAILVGNKIAYLDYEQSSTLRIIYASYKHDRETHRGISPLMCAEPVNTLVNRTVDMFIKNCEDTSMPIMIYAKGSMNQNQVDNVRIKKECEYNDINNIPQFFTPPAANPSGLQLLEMVLSQNKNVLGLNNYLSGDTNGAVRTARESAILFQKANARMRVETDVFSYRFLLPLFNAFYGFNRELALAADQPLDEIFADPSLKISISTNASRADKEGELNRLMQMLQLPIAQMIFSNLTPEQVVLAIRYIMSKAELTDGDNLLQLVDSAGRPTTIVPDNPNNNQNNNRNSQ